MTEVLIGVRYHGCQNPILGADFLQNYSLLVDMRCNRLSDALTQLKVWGIASHVLSLSPTLLPRRPLTEFESILKHNHLSTM